MQNSPVATQPSGEAALGQALPHESSARSLLPQAGRRVSVEGKEAFHAPPPRAGLSGQKFRLVPGRSFLMHMCGEWLQCLHRFKPRTARK